MPRDLEIVFAVGRLGQATSEQIRRLFFGDDPSTASRRLAKLVALRLLDVHVKHLDEPNVHALGSRAIQTLQAHGMSTAELHRSRVLRGMDHHLRLLNDVRVELVLATRRRNDVHLEAFHADLDLRRAAAATPPIYIPDAVVELKLGETTLVLMVEIDTGSEGLTAFLPKAVTTVALWQTNAKCWGAPPGTWRPAVFVPTATRARALARTIVEAGGGVLWLVAEFDRLREQGALGSIFATAEVVAAVPRGEPIPYQGALAPALAERPLKVRP